MLKTPPKFSPGDRIISIDLQDRENSDGGLIVEARTDCYEVKWGPFSRFLNTRNFIEENYLSEKEWEEANKKWEKDSSFLEDIKDL